jgi:hypothetical protein
VRCEKNYYKILTAVTLVARNTNDVMVAPKMGSGGVCVWQDSEIGLSVLCWCVW